MHGRRADLDKVRAVAADLDGGAEALLCVPATLISAAAEAAGGRLQIGGQDCHAAESGPHTGDVSAEMIRDAGASHVIVGHSERRQDHSEDDGTVAAKLGAAWRAGLIPILCVGETGEERDAGREEAVVSGQLDRALADAPSDRSLIVAYEPVWAIGTGRVPEPHEIETMHAHIHASLPKGAAPVLYGGSVKPDNAADLLPIPGVDGALIGGASLEPDDFLAICAAAPNEKRGR